MTTYSYLPRQHRTQTREHQNLSSSNLTAYSHLLDTNTHINKLLTHLSITPHFIKHLYPNLTITTDQIETLEENPTIQKLTPYIQSLDPTNPYQNNPDLIIQFIPNPTLAQHFQDTWRAQGLKHLITIATLYPSHDTQPRPNPLTTRYNHYNWTILTNRPHSN